MLQLPSGLVLDLSTHRAKYHALRRGGPNADADHAQLYGLVDLIIRRRNTEGEVCRGWTEYDYDYSGYTLAEWQQLPQLGAEDQQAVRLWLDEPGQLRVIETARRRLLDYQVQLSSKHSSAPTFLYSLLGQRLQSSSLQRASRAHWQATLEAMTGLRHEELHWSGLEAWLKAQPADAMLSKTQLQEALDFDKLRLEMSAELIAAEDGCLSFHETAQQLEQQDVYRAALTLDRNCLCILRFCDPHSNYRIGVVKTLDNNHPMALNKCWFALDPTGQALRPNDGHDLFPSSDDAMQAAKQHAWQIGGIRGGRKFHTRYHHLTLYGGHDYREWQVGLSDFQRNFFGAHHIDHNVLLHLRTTSRQDPQGRRLLFIEELQSDWHQQGQRHGYDNNPWGQIAHAPFKQEWAELALKLILIRASQNGYDAIAWTPGAIQEQRYGRELPTIRRRYDRDLTHALNRLGRHFQLQVEETSIATCDPWLNLVRDGKRWRVEDSQGKFKTRSKYPNRTAAMAVQYRHSRQIQLAVPMFRINEALRRQIAEQGLPLFGTTLR